ncbi:hypothetical protein L917_15008, partial [Phytophthora nicotianae]
LDTTNLRSTMSTPASASSTEIELSPGEVNGQQQYHLPAPPEMEYEAEEAAEAAIHAWTKAHRYNVSMKKLALKGEEKVRYRLYKYGQAGSRQPAPNSNVKAMWL